MKSKKYGTADLIREANEAGLEVATITNGSGAVRIVLKRKETGYKLPERCLICQQGGWCFIEDDGDPYKAKSMRPLDARKFLKGAPPKIPAVE